MGPTTGRRATPLLTRKRGTSVSRAAVVLPAEKGTFDTLVSRTVEAGKSLRDASAAVVPVKHTIRFEAVK